MEDEISVGQVGGLLLVGPHYLVGPVSSDGTGDGGNLTSHPVGVDWINLGEEGLDWVYLGEERG